MSHESPSTVADLLARIKELEDENRALVRVNKELLQELRELREQEQAELITQMKATVASTAH